MPAKEITTQVPEVAETVENLFVPAKKAIQRTGVKLFVWGGYGVGKTFLALSFPPPVRVISTEFGVAQLLHHFPDKDIGIMECTEPYTEAPIKARTGKADDQPLPFDPTVSLRKVEKASLALKNMEGGTIVLDSGTDLWSWLGQWIELTAEKQYSKTGGMMRTEWSKANARYRTILMRLLSRPTHFVMTGRSQQVYDGQGNQTAMEKFAAQKETPYFADIIVHLSKKPRQNVDVSTGKVTGSVLQRIGIIEKCRFGDTNNMAVTDPTYDSLKESLKTNVPPGVFS